MIHSPQPIPDQSWQVQPKEFPHDPTHPFTREHIRSYFTNQWYLYLTTDDIKEFELSTRPVPGAFFEYEDLASHAVKRGHHGLLDVCRVGLQQKLEDLAKKKAGALTDTEIHKFAVDIACANIGLLNGYRRSFWEKSASLVLVKIDVGIVRSDADGYIYIKNEKTGEEIRYSAEGDDWVEGKRFDFREVTDDEEGWLNLGESVSRAA
jgi:hypothetical protein